jgi:uncharacterized membrane protein SirB2
MLDFAEWLQATPLSVTIQSVGWVIPLLQSIHILMIGIVFVSILMIALRVLQRARMDEAFRAVWGRFAPWLWSGLVVMTLTGLLLVIGEPVRELTSTSFWLKMALLAVGVAGAVGFGRSLRAAAFATAAEPDFSTASKSAAIATVVLWLAIIFLGRAIAYDVEVWGPLSLALRT